jgi:hypothetical protein
MSNLIFYLPQIKEIEIAGAREREEVKEKWIRGIWWENLRT